MEALDRTLAGSPACPAAASRGADSRGGQPPPELAPQPWPPAKRRPRAGRAAGLVLAWCVVATGCALSPPPARPAARASTAPKPPAAPSVPASDTWHGVRVDDPYRNLENLADPRTRQWLDAQGGHAAEQLARIEGRDELARRIAHFSAQTGAQIFDVQRMPGGRVYWLERGQGQSAFRLILRVGQDAPRVLVDPGTEIARTGTPHAINYFAPSWDGRTLAYGLSAGGSENAELHLIDVASGKPLRPPIARVNGWGQVGWTADDRFLAFTQLQALPPGAPDTETYLDARVMLLERQRPEAPPRVVFGREHNPRLALERLDFGALISVPGSRHVIVRTTDTTSPEGKLFVAPLASLAEAGAVPWRALSGPEHRITHMQLRGDTLLLRTTRDAPRGRIDALALDDPRATVAQARTVVPQPATGVIEEFGAGPQALYVEWRQGFGVRVRRHAPGDGAEGVDIAPGLSGSTTLVNDPAHVHTEPWITTSEWTAPPRTLQLSADGRLIDTGLPRRGLPAGAPEMVVREVLVPSHDGAQVPLAILHRKGLAIDGRRPTLLIGYGAYGASMEARFDADSLAWIERGGVVALANVRGSGAFGDSWHRAGFKQTKANTWKDGIACARWLIAQGYATRATLGVWGTSAGGIFVGRVVTEAPELFAAAIFDVGMLDVVRSEFSANGITNISEFGSVINASEFPALLDMSTYHQVRDGTAYPAVLLVHGLQDPRVDFWNSAKTAARLQAATSSGKPVLLRLDAKDGHGVGRTAQQRQLLRADIYAFLLWQFGMLQAAH